MSAAFKASATVQVRAAIAIDRPFTSTRGGLPLAAVHPAPTTSSRMIA
jgi:hypothetical protein